MTHDPVNFRDTLFTALTCGGVRAPAVVARCPADHGTVGTRP